jgi:predicted nucleic acid-binding protein
MKHVFVETNWVVAYCAPKHVQLPAALQLAESARAGDIRLYLPSICLTEAQQPIRTKYHPRHSADAVRKYLAWAETAKTLRDECEVVRRILDQYEAAVIAELEQLEERLLALLATLLRVFGKCNRTRN